MFNFKHLLYFNAVYQYKNFTQAGDSLFVSQPTISAAINTLESDLGVKLIERSPKNVLFTYEGEQFILWVRKILSLCQEAETAMRDSRTRQISICAWGCPTPSWPPPRLRSSLTS